MDTNIPQNAETQEDLLERLLAGAAEKEARKVAEELTQKGSVSKKEFSAALGEFESGILTKIDTLLTEKLQKALPQEKEQEQEQEEQPVQKAGRRGLVQGSTDPREDNPVKYLIQKSRKGEEFDQIDRELIWKLTIKGFTQGMSTAPIDGDDFADEYSN